MSPATATPAPVKIAAVSVNVRFEDSNQPRMTRQGEQYFLGVYKKTRAL
jgi:hypothetical protein